MAVGPHVWKIVLRVPCSTAAAYYMTHDLFSRSAGETGSAECGARGVASKGAAPQRFSGPVIANRESACPQTPTQDFDAAASAISVSSSSCVTVIRAPSILITSSIFSRPS